MKNINIWGSGSGKTNALLNLIKQQDADSYSVIDTSNNIINVF